MPTVTKKAHRSRLTEPSQKFCVTGTKVFCFGHNASLKGDRHNSKTQSRREMLPRDGGILDVLDVRSFVILCDVAKAAVNVSVMLPLKLTEPASPARLQLTLAGVSETDCIAGAAFQVCAVQFAGNG